MSEEQTRNYRALELFRSTLQSKIDAAELPPRMVKEVAKNKSLYTGSFYEYRQDALHKKFGDSEDDFSRSLVFDLNRVHSIRRHRKEYHEDFFGKKLQDLCNEVESVASTCFKSESGFLYSFMVNCGFKTRIRREGMSFPCLDYEPNTAKVDIKLHNGSPLYNVKALLSPNWIKRVGREYSVVHLSSEKAFVLDRDDLTTDVWAEQGLNLYRMKAVGRVPSSYQKAIANKLNADIDAAEDFLYDERTPKEHRQIARDAALNLAMNASVEFSTAMARSEPINYYFYYLEHKELSDMEGYPMFSTGATVHQAKALMDRRVKAESLKALEL